MKKSPGRREGVGPCIEDERPCQARRLNGDIEPERIVRVGIGIESMVPLEVVAVADLEVGTNLDALFSSECRPVGDDRQNLLSFDQIARARGVEPRSHRAAQKRRQREKATIDSLVPVEAYSDSGGAGVAGQAVPIEISADAGAKQPSLLGEGSGLVGHVDAVSKPPGCSPDERYLGPNRLDACLDLGLVDRYRLDVDALEETRTKQLSAPCVPRLHIDRAACREVERIRDDAWAHIAVAVHDDGVEGLLWSFVDGQPELDRRALEVVCRLDG